MTGMTTTTAPETDEVARLRAELAEAEASAPDAPEAAEVADQYSGMNREQKRAADKAAADEGFIAPRKVFRLTFDEDSGMAGLVVRARGLNVGKLLDLVGMASKVEAGTDELDPEQMQAVHDLFAGFADALVSWNLRAPDLDEHGEPIPGRSTPVPPTPAGMLGEELNTVMPIIMRWIEAVSGVAAPLGGGSNGSGTSPGPSIPMAEPS